MLTWWFFFGFHLLYPIQIQHHKSILNIFSHALWALMNDNSAKTWRNDVLVTKKNKTTMGFNGLACVFHFSVGQRHEKTRYCFEFGDAAISRVPGSDDPDAITSAWANVIHRKLNYQLILLAVVDAWSCCCLDTVLLLSACDIEDTLKPRKGRGWLLAADELMTDQGSVSRRGRRVCSLEQHKS